jgi:hypothetical protein
LFEEVDFAGNIEKKILVESVFVKAGCMGLAGWFTLTSEGEACQTREQSWRRGSSSPLCALM